jgi:hypothetical protein
MKQFKVFFSHLNSLYLLVLDFLLDRTSPIEDSLQIKFQRNIVLGMFWWFVIYICPAIGVTYFVIDVILYSFERNLATLIVLIVMFVGAWGILLLNIDGPRFGSKDKQQGSQSTDSH